MEESHHQNGEALESHHGKPIAGLEEKNPTVGVNKKILFIH